MIKLLVFAAVLTLASCQDACKTKWPWDCDKRGDCNYR